MSSRVGWQAWKRRYARFHSKNADHGSVGYVSDRRFNSSVSGTGGIDGGVSAYHPMLTPRARGTFTAYGRSGRADACRVFAARGETAGNRTAAIGNPSMAR